MRLKRTFKVNIVFTFTVLLLISGLSITSFTYYKNRSATLEFVRDSFTRSARGLMEKTTGYMHLCQVLTEVSVKVLEDPDIEIGLGTGLETYLLEIVTTQDQIDLMYFGDETGSFLQATQIENQTYSKYIERDADGKATTNFKHFDDDLNLASMETKENDSYDPRVRPWYKGAKETQKTYWTEPYIFHENKKPGITVASPVYRDDGGLKGIVASDITLAGLSDFLKETKLSPNSLALIVDSNNQLVAYPDPDKMVTMENGKLRNLRPQELNLPSLTEAIRQYEDQKTEMISYAVDGKRHLAYFAEFPKSFGKNWTIAILAPEGDFLGAMKETLEWSLILSAVVLVLAVVIGIILARQLSRPIEELTEEVREVQDFKLDRKREISSPIHEIQMMSRAINNMKNGLMAFQRYVPAQLVKQLIASGEEATIGGKDRELTIFFSDISNFTAISEDIPPRDLMIQLSEYFEAVGSVISAEGGTVDKFIGDAVMAFWGAPLVNDDHALGACRAALACKRAVNALNARWETEDKVQFRTRFGLHTGYAIVGNVGSQQRMNYTALGDCVNLANRLETVNKRYGTQIIFSRPTYRYAQNQFICRVLDRIAVKGKDQSTVIYELLADKGAPDAEVLERFAADFEAAYDLYIERQWQDALKRWETLLETYPDDQPTRLYIERCRKYIETEPDETWTGVTRLDRK